MEKIKRIFGKTAESPFFLLSVIGFFVLAFHIFVPLGYGDDAWFLDEIQKYTLFSFLKLRYFNWSSRVLIEATLVTLVQHKWLWRILDTAVILIILYCISYIFADVNNKKSAAIAISALALFSLPPDIYAGAGWISTSVNYSWPLAFGLVGMIPLKKILCGREIKPLEYVVYIAASLYAVNQEQMCAIFLAVYATFFVYCLLIRKKLNPFLAIQTVLGLGGIVFTLSAPGNAVRSALSTAKYFPDFGEIPFFQKIEMGYSSTLFEFIMRPNVVFLIFGGLLLACMIITHKSWVFRVISAIPLFLSLFFGLFYSLLEPFCPQLLSARNSLTEYGTGFDFSSFKTWIPDIIITIAALCILISAFLLFKDKWHSLLFSFIILLGFASRMAMSFSPTIWVSGNRTFMFMYFSFIICCVILYQRILNSPKQKFVLYTCNICIALLSSFGLMRALSMLKTFI